MTVQADFMKWFAPIATGCILFLGSLVITSNTAIAVLEGKIELLRSNDSETSLTVKANTASIHALSLQIERLLVLVVNPADVYKKLIDLEKLILEKIK